MKILLGDRVVPDTDLAGYWISGKLNRISGWIPDTKKAGYPVQLYLEKRGFLMQNCFMWGQNPLSQSLVLKQFVVSLPSWDFHYFYLMTVPPKAVGYNLRTFAKIKKLLCKSREKSIYCHP